MKGSTYTSSLSISYKHNWYTFCIFNNGWYIITVKFNLDENLLNGCTCQVNAGGGVEIQETHVCQYIQQICCFYTNYSLRSHICYIKKHIFLFTTN